MNFDERAREARIKEAFLRLHELAGERLQAAKAALFAEDPQLAAEVFDLLAAAEVDFEPAVDGPSIAAALDGLGQIGPYRLRRVLGVGAMGAVYEADQEEPVRRRVALKILEGTPARPRFLERFQAEIEALSRVQHPAIARLLDAGFTREGAAYIAMDLVKGEPITRWAKAERPPLRRLLELFTEVCRGVQHAHDRGVIHRDLKPSNILVEERDGIPHARIIDFGIAKASEGNDALAKEPITALGEFVGTIEYMSPEQADPRHKDTDIRTDVYSLGVVLYELLTGALPIDSARLRSLSLVDAIQALAKDPIVPPSRRAPLGGMARDLDAIVLTALSRDRARRYRFAMSLAEDLERLLSGHVVQARPPSRMHALAKFLRRHRVLATATLLVTASLVIGLCSSVSAWKSQRLAMEALKQERDRAMAERQESEEYATAIRDLIWAAAPTQLGTGATMVQVLQHAADRFLAASMPSDLVGARVAQAMADPLRYADDVARAEALGRVALKGYRAAATERGGIFYAHLAWAANFVGVLAEQRGASDEALSLRREALEAARIADAPILVANTLLLLADGLSERDQEEEAYALRAEAEALVREHSKDPVKVSMTCIQTVRSLVRTGRYLEALERGEEVLIERRDLKLTADLFLVEHLLVLAEAALQIGHLERAERFAREALRRTESDLGSQPRLLAWAESSLLRTRIGTLAAAQDYEALLQRDAAVDRTSPLIRIMRQKHLVELLSAAGDLDAARELALSLARESEVLTWRDRRALLVALASFLALYGDLECAGQLLATLLTEADRTEIADGGHVRNQLQKRIDTFQRHGAEGAAQLIQLALASQAMNDDAEPFAR